jgi:hypothetical protein
MALRSSINDRYITHPSFVAAAALIEQVALGLMALRLSADPIRYDREHALGAHEADLKAKVERTVSAAKICGRDWSGCGSGPRPVSASCRRAPRWSPRSRFFGRYRSGAVRDGVLPSIG